MATNNDKPRSMIELTAKLEARSDAAWKRHVEKHARIGESWEEAGARLRREKEIAEAAAATLAPPKPATGQKSQQADPEERPEAPSSHFVADTCGAEIKDDIASMEHPIFALRAGDKRVRVYERN
ncbi:replication initiator protein A, partial [Ventosimonas gracilis]|uniref:replication initiator protein A n=1 Tax=Ventosimonas gracilis TaxID=1680762 RepID=UPI000AF66FE9